jgi:hypothetical protein
MNYRRSLMALVAALVLFGSCNNKGCGGGEAFKCPTDSAAVVLLFLRTDAPQSTGPSDVKCDARIIWQLTPVTFTGKTGSQNTVTLDKSYQATESNQHCEFGDMVIGLRPGTWKVSAQTPNTWRTECTITISECLNNVRFTFNRQGCSQDPFKYPGD